MPIRKPGRATPARRDVLLTLCPKRNVGLALPDFIASSRLGARRASRVQRATMLAQQPSFSLTKHLSWAQALDQLPRIGRGKVVAASTARLAIMTSTKTRPRRVITTPRHVLQQTGLTKTRNATTASEILVLIRRITRTHAQQVGCACGTPAHVALQASYQGPSQDLLIAQLAQAAFTLPREPRHARNA